MSAPVSPPEALEVVIGPMRRRHLRGVLRIEQRVYPRPWSMGLFLSEIGHGADRVYRTARVHHAVVGYGGLMVAAEDGHVTTLAVDPAWHRAKIGTRLLLALARGAIAEGCTNLTLEVRAGNEAAQRLYRQFGFAPAGVRRGYYAETNEDAIVMWATDVDTPEYAARLRRIEHGVPGATILEAR